MRFFVAIGAVALLAINAAAEQTGETQADNSNYGNVRVLTSSSVTQTVYVSDCLGGKCDSAAQTIPPSTGTLNALTVLSNALNTPTPSNALVILSEAEGSFAVPFVTLTFSPELYSSYGLSNVGGQSNSQETTVAPPATSADVPATTTTPIVVTTDTAAPSTLSTITSGESTANPVSSSAATGEVTTNPTTAVPVPSTSGLSTYGDSTVIPIGGGSSTTIPVGTDTTAGPESTGAGPTDTAGSTGGAGASPTQSDNTANPATGTSTDTGAGAAETTPAPVNFGTTNKPAAYGGLVAAVGALFFI